MKWKRPAALLGVILILCMYAAALISALSHNPNSTSWLMAAIFSTVVIPVIIYAMQLAARLMKGDEKKEDFKN